MATTNLLMQSNAGTTAAKKPTSSTFSRVVRYTIVRAITLALTVVVGVYIAIIVANLGGLVDNIVREGIDNAIDGMMKGGWLRDVPQAEKLQIVEQTTWQMEEAAGLHQPFLLRCLRWLYHSLTFQGASARVLEYLPNTLLLFGAANLLFFFMAVSLALFLSRKYGSLLDRLIVTLSPISSAPSWTHGIILVIIFAAELRVLPFNGMFDAYPPATRLEYVLVVLKHMILPVSAIFLSTFFQCVYAWRSFFLIHSGEDYVEMARAKGLPAGVIERRYVLRPTFPYIITNFALMLISLWQGSIALEYFFYWPGIGKLYIDSIKIISYNSSVVVGIVVIFAYFLAISVFFLDIVYALVDPRVRVAGGDQPVSVASRKTKMSFRCRSLREPVSVQKRVWTPPAELTPPTCQSARITLSGRIELLRQSIGRLKRTLGEIARYPTAMVGLAIIVALIAVSIYTVSAIPYDEAVTLWRGDENNWYRNPMNVPPAWINLFRKDDLPNTIVLNSSDGTASKSVSVISEEITEITISFPFDYPYGAFPQELSVYFTARYGEKRPHLFLTWLTPDGREIELGAFSTLSSKAYYFSQDSRLQRKLDGQPPQQALFADPAAETPLPLEGSYELRVSGLVFEADADLDAEFVLYGQVHGLAGTDHRRRDLMLALLWGAPVALALGLLGAVCSTLASTVIAAVGVWFGGWIDGLIQRITEVNVILPVLPIGIMVYVLYSKNVWAVLGIIILLSTFGGSIKNCRAAFLQVKESPYIEAARAYGANDWQILLRYLIPRVIPALIPQLVALIPGYVFLEATLAILTVSDPRLPTWGKVIYDALTNGVWRGYYYWVLEPIGLLMLTGVAFAMLGFALDRIFNPRLRNV